MGDPLHALVVDDTPINVKLVTALLKANGFAVTIATSGEAALELVNTAEFQLMLLDLRLPGIDGLTVARTVRAGSHQQLVIVALTASAMKTDVAAALEAGCDAFVSKPINTRTLIPMLLDLLARRRPA
jgi:CheY-like chemotaxis protein